MAYICYKDLDCKNCKHYRKDSESDRMCCWAAQDENEDMKHVYAVAILHEPKTTTEAIESLIIKHELDPMHNETIVKVWKPRVTRESVISASGETIKVQIYIAAIIKHGTRFDFLLLHGIGSKEIIGMPGGSGVLVNKQFNIERYRKEGINYGL